MTERLRLFAVAAPGLEPIVARELTALGEQPSTEDGGVSWEGDFQSLMRANLWLRTASRVVVRMASFKATAFFELEKRAKKLPWKDFLPAGQSAEFRVTSRKSRLYHSDAIAERLRLWVTGTEGPPAAGADAQLFVVRVVHDTVEISADASGALLHQRGYRQAVAKAPLRETLAAALLLGAGWTGESALMDPMCGSGTIPIEGALIARRIAPGIQRDFAFCRWPAFDAAAWESVRTGARSGERSAGVPIVGTDRDAGAVEAAIANAERAGVAADVQFGRAALSAMKAVAGTGLVATNPPYGVRVQGAGDIRNLYAQLGNVLRERFAGWTVAFYSPEARLTSQLGIPVSERFVTTNGGIRVSANEARI